MREERTRGNVYATAETVLIAYADPGVLASAETADINAERLLDGGSHTVYICAPAHEQRRLQPLFATLIQEIVAGAYERAQHGKRQAARSSAAARARRVRQHRPSPRPRRRSRRPGAGQGIQLVSVFQDMAQINAVYGRDHAPTIVSNHRAKVVLSGIGDPRTLDYVAALLGDEEVRQVASTRGAEGRRSTTESFTYRTLAPAHVLREMTPGHGSARLRAPAAGEDRHAAVVQGSAVATRRKRASRGAVQAEGYGEGHGREPELS